MMKKRTRAVAIFLLMTSGMVQAADTATITITGRVLANTCTLDNKTLSVELPTISTVDFGGAAGKEAGEVVVPVSFSNCGEDVKSISVKISGTPDPDDSGSRVFKNSGTSDGVGVVLYDTDGIRFKPDGTSNAVAIKPNGGTASKEYKAKYRSTKSEVKGGTVSTVITATFTYS